MTDPYIDLDEKESDADEFDEAVEGPVQLILVRRVDRKNQRYEAKRILTGGKITVELRAIVDATNNKIANCEEFNYSVGDVQAKNTVLRVTRDQVFDNELIQVVSAAQLKSLKVKQIWNRNVVCYVLRIAGTTGDPDAYYFRKSNPVKLMSSSVVVRALASHLQKIEDPILAFDDHIDVIVEGTLVFALNVNNFELLFKGSDVVSTKVDYWFKTLFPTLPFAEGFKDKFRAKVLNGENLWKKLNEMDQAGLGGKITVAKIRTQAKARRLDPNNFIKNGKIECDELDMRDLLSLMNEDTFEGAFTGRQLRSSGKRELRPRQRRLDIEV